MFKATLKIQKPLERFQQKCVTEGGLNNVHILCNTWHYIFLHLKLSRKGIKAGNVTFISYILCRF